MGGKWHSETISELGAALRLLKERGQALVSELALGQSEQTVLKRSALSAFLVRVLSAALAYLSQIILARFLGDFEYGVYAYVWVWVIILGHITNLGFSQSVIRFVPIYLEKQDSDKVRGFLLASQLIAFFGSAALSALGALGVYVFQDYLDSHYVIPFYIAAICIPLFALQDLQEGIARAFGWVNLGLVPIYLVRPVLLMAFLAAAILGGATATAATALWAAIAASFVAGVLQIAVIFHRAQKRVPFRGGRGYELLPWLATSLPLALVNIFDMAQTYADLLILNLYVPPEKLAIYFAAAKTVGLVNFIHFAVGAAVGQKFSAYEAAGKRRRLRLFARQTTNWTFWPALLSALGILALGHPLLWLFGSNFTEGYSLMFILAAGIIVHATAGQAEFLLSMLGHQKLVAGAMFLTLFLNVALNLLLIPHYGMTGAAIATAIAMGTKGLGLAAAVKWKTGLDILLWWPGRPKNRLLGNR